MKKINLLNKFSYIGCFFIMFFTGMAFAETINQDKWHRITALHGVPTKISLDRPAIYIFFDPNCSWSAKLYNSKVDGKLFGEVDAIWLPVHYMHPDSFSMAAALLRGGNVALHDNFSLFDYDKRKGHSGSISPNGQEINDMMKIDRVWRELSGTLGTPIIVSKDRAGVIQLQLGFPPRSILDEITSGAASAHLQDYDGNAQSRDH